MIKVMLVDDHQIFLDGMISILNNCSNIQVVGSAITGNAAIKIIENEALDVMVLDITLPDINGLDLIKSIHQIKPNIAILMLSMHAEESFVRTAIDQGALGYVLKKSTTEELERAIRKTHQGEYYYCSEVSKLIMNGVAEKKQPSNYIDLTTRELEVLQCISEGKTTKAIGEELFISPNTVKTHRKNLLEKLPVKNTAELIKFAMENNLLD